MGVLSVYTDVSLTTTVRLESGWPQNDLVEDSSPSAVSNGLSSVRGSWVERHSIFTMLTIAFVLCAMQAMAYASPVVQAQSGMPIAISKRQISVDDVVVPDILNSLIQSLEG